jgi:glycine oxidase
LLQALRLACERAGVTISHHCTVEDVVTAGAIVTGVRTETETIHCGRVIICAGAWSSCINPHLETVIPVFPVRGQMVLLRVEQTPFHRVICCGRTYLVPRRDGLVLLGATEEPDAGFTQRNTARGIASLIESGLRLVPSLQDAAVQATWAGLRPGTPDDRPYLGRVPGMRGLYAATGHFRSGLTLAPLTAEALSAIVSERDFAIDLTPLRPARA